ncbi:cupin [Oscillatoriales cyanobacterium LEGE 11467]|uniref:Cupin n=1 Tax=Zarconia navalis LEGE 11467 TaxID=1828826 RepID=A0A928VSQ9_9CYAN|nr:cupin domain-containing protein [Zarconia navalis]MBE9039694.1 cupin [Zarconia navalis LEGE 11467]
MKTFANLLHPYSIEQFLGENWSRRGVLIPGEKPEKFSSLFSWQQLNDLLNFHKIQHPEIRFSLKNQTLPPCEAKHWVKYCQQGATLVLDHVHDRIPALTDWIWALQEEIGQNTAHLNMYCSWPSKQGFNNHFDTHEVFILQIDGTKEWFVFDETMKYPLRKDNGPSHKPPEGEPYIHQVLEPGDLLYIPRGHWHYAVACDRPSLHLTLGIRCLTGSDLLDWLIGEFKEEEAWRQNLPLMPNGNTEPLERGVQSLFDRLKATLDREELILKYSRRHATTNPRAPEISLPEQVGFGIFDRGLDTRFRQTKFQTLKLEPLPESGYQILTGGKKITFKGANSKLVDDLLDNLLNCEAFTVGDAAQWLPDFDLETQILPILSGLVKEGMILVE